MVLKKQNQETGLIFGVHSVKALLEKRPGSVKAVYMARLDKGPAAEIKAKARANKIEVIDVDGRELGKMCRSDAHQGVAAKAPLPDYQDLEDVINLESGLIVALDSVTDPHNLGAIARTAEALGATGMVVPKDRAAGITATAHKASAGALEFLPVFLVTNLARSLRSLKDAGWFVYSAEAGAEIDLYDVDFAEKTVIVIGSEGSGARPGVKKEADLVLRIPLRGRTNSLNASVASAIILSAAIGRRK